MLLLTGTTGHLGRATLDTLLRTVPASSVAVLVRNPTGADALRALGVDVRVGTYDDPSSLDAAFSGVTTLLLVSGSDVANRLQQHRNVIDAAVRAGVGRVVYTSFVRKDDGPSAIGIVGSSHVETDAYLKASGLAWTILRNGLYADMLPLFLGDRVLETGVFLPAGDGRVAFTSRAELGEVAANVLATDGHAGKDYVVTSDELVGMAEVAAVLSDITGHPVPYLAPTRDRFTSTLQEAGVPADGIWITGAFGQAIADGTFDVEDTDMPQLLGRAPKRLRTTLTELYGKP